MTETPPRTETDRVNAANGPATSAADLLSGILDDAQTLIRQQAAMLRAEIREDIRRTGDVARYMSIGAVMAAIGGLFLMISLVYLLNSLAAPHLPLWSCWAIVGALFILLGGAALYAGKRILNTYNPLPDKTFQALEENLTWKTTNPRN